MSRPRDDVELITPEDAARLLNISVRLLYTKAKADPKFPQPIKVSHKRRAFVAHEIREWIQLQSLLR